MSVVAQPESETDDSEVVDVSHCDPAHVEWGDRRTADRNFWLMVLYQVVIRTGWIFKTESIVMPAVLDLTGAGAWMRAILPSLNRFGQTVPPLLYSSRLSTQRIKKYSLALFTATMGSCFLLLALSWGAAVEKTVPLWFGWLFLAAYGAFFIATGLNQISFGTLQGKLIPPQRRGRLFLASNVIGVTIAVIVVWCLLPGWLVGPLGSFEWIFGFTGSCFVVSTFLILLVREHPDEVTNPAPLKRRRFAHSFEQLRHDPHLRRISIVAASLGASFMLFPHYQAMARERLGLGLDQIVIWVIVQNLGTALFSVPAGWLADRSGNRAVLRCCMGLLLVAPLLAWWLSKQPGSITTAFAGVFFFVGLTPVSLRVLSNYTLELTHRDNHPIYLSSMGLSLGIPTIVLSPFLGMLIDWVGFDVAFWLTMSAMMIGFLMTFVIIEPRRNSPIT